MNYATNNMNQFHYDVGFADGYLACKKDFAEKVKSKREEKAKALEKTLYFLKQKLFGIFMALFSILSIWILEGDATVAILMFPLGVLLFFSKDPLVYGRYYWKYREEKE